MEPTQTALAETVNDATKLKRIGFARLGAEGISIGCAMGGLMLSKSLLDQPLQPLKNFVADRLILPYINAYDNALDRLPSIQTPSDKDQLKGLSKHERAKRYADGMVDFSVALGAGFAGQIGGQILFDRVCHVPQMNNKSHLRVAFIDRSVQFGGVMLLNTLLARPSIELQHKLTNMLHKQFGMDVQHADDQASYVVNWQIPNVMGMAAAIAAHYAESKPMIWK